MTLANSCCYRTELAYGLMGDQDWWPHTRTQSLILERSMAEGKLNANRRGQGVLVGRVKRK